MKQKSNKKKSKLMTREEIIPLLDAETWMSADDALEYSESIINTVREPE